MAKSSQQNRIALVLEQDEVAREDVAEDLLGVADCAIRERLGLKLPGGPSVGLQTLSSEKIVRIIEAARIPLAGWQLGIDDWAAPGDGRRWCTDGFVRKLVFNRDLPAAADPTAKGHVSPRHELTSLEGAAGWWEREKRFTRLRAFTEEHFVFDETDALVRTVSCDRLANTSEMATVRVRMPEERRPITPDEVFGAMAALLGAFGPLRLSLMGAVDKRVGNLVANVKESALDLARQLRQQELSFLREEGSEALEALCDSYTERFKLLQAVLEGSDKRPQALTHLMGPAVACFELLFGRRAMRGTSETPFSRFVVAFLGEVGCAYKCRTVDRQLAHWRKACRKPARTCAQRVHD